MIATLLVNLWVVRYEAGAAARLNSELLLADSLHTRSDVFTTIGVFLADGCLAGISAARSDWRRAHRRAHRVYGLSRLRAKPHAFCPIAWSSTRGTSTMSS